MSASTVRRCDKERQHHTKLTQTIREPSQDCFKFMVLAVAFAKNKKCFYLEKRFVVSSVFAPKKKTK